MKKNFSILNLAPMRGSILFSVLNVFQNNVFALISYTLKYS